MPPSATHGFYGGGDMDTVAPASHYVGRELTMLSQRRAATPPPSQRAAHFIGTLPSTPYAAPAPPQRSGTAGADTATHGGVPPRGVSRSPVAPQPLLGPPPPGARFTVVLDLDETLVYARPQVTRGQIWVRPGAEQLLQVLRDSRPAVEAVAWTAADDRHAGDVLRVLHAIVPNVFSACITRDHPGTQWFSLGGYQKDIALLGRREGTVLLVDNTPDCVRPNSGASIIISDFDPSRPDHVDGSGAGAMDGLGYFVRELAQATSGTVGELLSCSQHVIKRRVEDPKGILLWDTAVLDRGPFTPPPSGNRDLAPTGYVLRHGRAEQPGSDTPMRAGSQPPPPVHHLTPPSNGMAERTGSPGTQPGSGRSSGPLGSRSYDRPGSPTENADPQPGSAQASAASTREWARRSSPRGEAPSPPPRPELGGSPGSAFDYRSGGSLRSAQSQRGGSWPPEAPMFPALSTEPRGASRSPAAEAGASRSGRGLHGAQTGSPRTSAPSARSSHTGGDSPSRRSRATRSSEYKELGPAEGDPMPRSAPPGGSDPLASRRGALLQQAREHTSHLQRLREGFEPESFRGELSEGATHPPAPEWMQIEEGMEVEAKDLYGRWWRIRVTGSNGDGTYRATVYDNIRTDWKLVHPANCRPVGGGDPRASGAALELTRRLGDSGRFGGYSPTDVLCP
eukprot:TRINITY_DN20966_c0_g1_i1.p1 TRINITY_DN20966_c0_g1~~TRINITY_DN20966_c0_g1_i1.p1  ORF type:complete len:717 (+),score=153.21 TRINITY_DN20966_c0_g1_i1:115-2151(+)